MKSVHAISWQRFCDIMTDLGLDDSNIETEDGAAIIEVIGECHIEGMPFHFREDHPNVLRLVFDDVEEDCVVPVITLLGPTDYQAFTMSKEQGKQIMDFVRDNESASQFIVHCAAGISRSGSIAKFINEYLGQPEGWFWQNNPQCQPKAGFLKTLRDAAQQK